LHAHSCGGDHHRFVAVTALGVIKNDYDDYLGTGPPLKTDDDLHARTGRAHEEVAALM